jgi:hypothetical protein
MSSVNRDWIPMKLHPAVTCQLHNLIYVGDQKPCAHFLASNIYEWGLSWESNTDGQTRIPLQILIPDDDQVDGEPKPLPTKGLDVLKIQKLHTTYMLLIVSEHVALDGCKRVYGLVLTTSTLNPKLCTDVSRLGFVFSRRGPLADIVIDMWPELVVERQSANAKFINLLHPPPLRIGRGQRPQADLETMIQRRRSKREGIRVSSPKRML